MELPRRDAAASWGVIQKGALMSTSIVLWGAAVVLGVLYLVKRRARLKKDD